MRVKGLECVTFSAYKFWTSCKYAKEKRERERERERESIGLTELALVDSFDTMK